MNTLRLLPQFEEALRDYHYSDKAKQILAQTKLVLLVGATASGRNTTIRELLKTDRYHFIVSDTTRPPRTNNGVMEQNGIEYFFRTEEEMLAEIKNGDFLEAEIIHGRQVSGISMRELEKANQEHRIAINDVDIGGIQNVLALKPDTIAILMLPPSFEIWQSRIFGRGEMPTEVYKSRLETAVRVFQSAQQIPELHYVINDSISESAIDVDTLVQGGTLSSEKTAAAKQLVGELLSATTAKLAELA